MKIKLLDARGRVRREVERPRVVMAPAPARVTGPGGEVAVVVTAHRPYLGLLAGVIESIEAQGEIRERVVVLDGCRAPRWLRRRPGWGTVEGQWGQPGPARNAGLWATRAPWVIWFDADNLMPEGYVQAQREAIATAGTRTAIIYPDLQYCDERMAPTRLWRMPEFDYWALRRGNYVDTSAAWRRSAVEAVGGWDATLVLDDHALALAITRAGWRGEHLRGPAVLMRRHKGQRSELRWRDANMGLETLWGARTLAVVTLLAGREQTWWQWLDWLTEAYLPPRTTLYVVDNSGDAEFGARARKTLEGPGGWALRYMLDTRRLPNGAGPLERHEHVAGLYRRALPKVGEDLVLTLEDDVMPPCGAVRRLHEHFDLGSDVGAAAGAYPSPVCAKNACAARDHEAWRDSPRMDGLREQEEMGFVGAGCTLWANWALRKVGPQWAAREGQGIMGWDAQVSRDLRHRGYRLILDGRVVCAHHVHGEMGQDG